MKKIIILLMAVSIMLTSCGKSAGLSNRNKGADNKTLSAAGAGKKQLPQGTNYKNSSKKSSADTIKEYWHAASDFLLARKVYVIGTVVLLIALGSAYHYRDNISHLFSKIWKTSAAQEKEISDLKTQNAELTAQNEQKDEKYEALRKQSDDFSKLANTQISSANTQNTLLQKDNKTKSDIINRLQVNNQFELERLEKKNEDQLVEINWLRNENNDKTNAIDQNKQDYENLSEYNEALLAEINRLRNESNDKTNTINQKEQDCENLSEHNKTLLAEIERLKQALLKADENEA